VVASATDTNLVAELKKGYVHCNYRESKHLSHSNFEDTVNIIASFLDPRFKAHHLNDELPLIKQRVIREGVKYWDQGVMMKTAKLYQQVLIEITKVNPEKQKTYTS